MRWLGVEGEGPFLGIGMGDLAVSTSQVFSFE